MLVRATVSRCRSRVPPFGARAMHRSARRAHLDVAWHYKVPLEGACEGSVACSTCHVILPSQIYSSLDEPSETEEYCLDLAPGLSETSRLGCQVRVHDGFEGAVIDLPAVTVNFYVDGFVPNQH